MLKWFAAVAVAIGLTSAVAGTVYYRSTSALTEPVAETGHAEARHQITCDVIDGRLSLLKAAAAFHEINTRAPAVPKGALLAYPGETDEERVCHQVINHVNTELEFRSESDQAQMSVNAADTVLARLQAELKAGRGKDGKVRFPGGAN
jgi:hypothetical protein